MSLSFTIRTVAALAVSFLLGIIGLVIMFQSEEATANHFQDYFHWALGGGLVFLGVAVAWVFYCRQDAVETVFPDAAKK